MFVASWVVCGATLLIVAARLVIPDFFLVLIWANAYTFWVYLPAYAVAAFAGLLGRWVLFGCACTVIAFHLAWVLPDYRPAQEIPARAYSAPRLRLMTANIYFGNPNYDGLVGEIAEVDPDVLFLQEFGPRMEEDMRTYGLIDRYPYTKIVYENPYFGTALYSKLPLSEVIVAPAGRRPYIAASVEVGGRKVRLYNLHATSPGIGADIAEDWNDGWKTLLTALRKEDGPVIAAGDFNMTQNHHWYRELKKAGFVSAHDERGRGNATTWPQGELLLPMIRIDQVFHSAGVVCLSIREGRGEGSDHRPLIAELAITGP